jgi:large repetitive protein
MRLISCCVLVGLALCSPALAAPRLPDLDAFVASPAARELPDAAPQLARLAVVSHLERRLGVPTFVWAIRGAGSAGSAADLDGLTAEQAARRHLHALAPLYRLRAEDVAAAQMRAVHDTGVGGIIASFRQRAEGIEVFRAGVSVLMNRRLELVAISGYLSPHALAAKGYARAFEVPLQAAAAAAFADLTGAELEASALAPTEADEHGYVRLSSPASLTERLPLRPLLPLRAKRVLFQLPGWLEPAYYVEVNAGDPRRTDPLYYSYVISASDGRVLFRRNLTHHAAFTYRVWADPSSRVPYHGPQGTVGSPHPTGLRDGFQAPFIAPSLITLEHAGLSTGDPWLSGSATVSSGNNVDAYLDLAGPDGFNAGDMRAATTSANTFDHTYDVTRVPGADHTQHQAAAATLFYVNNFLHDWFYDHGFDEASGNAQRSNFGRGGIGNDPLLAEGQDYSELDNASMQIPADGASPKMQMHIFRGNGARRLQIS